VHHKGQVIAHCDSCRSGWRLHRWRGERTRLARPVGAHHAPAVLLGQLDGSDRFGDRSDLVDLEQQAVGCLLLDGPLDEERVGDGQVVAHNLRSPIERPHEP
jgi:hypothetical protein